MVSMNTEDKAIRTYINRIKNANKKQYACEYYNFKTGLTNITPVYHGQSGMARQAVEHEVNTIIALQEVR